MYTRPRRTARAAVADQPLTFGAPRQNHGYVDPNVPSAMHNQLTDRSVLRHVNLRSPDLVLRRVPVPEDDIRSASPQHSEADLRSHSDEVADDEANFDGLQVEHRGTEHSDPAAYIPVDIENSGQPYEEAFGTSSALRASALRRFMEWAVREKSWIETCIEFAVTGALFDRILELINAPFKSITVKRNLNKYENLDTIKYVVCHSHMVIGRLSVEPDTNYVCDICTANETNSEFTTFEYLPLRPRVLAWSEDPDSFKDVTSCRKQKMLERMYEHDLIDSGSSGPVYEDYFDGSWFKEIAQMYGGQRAVEYDIFIALSSDGFQPFENTVYECWPILALNPNLSPSKRFLLKNVIHLGYIKGPEAPDWLDTFFLPVVEECEEMNNEGGTEIRCADGVNRKIRVHVI